MIKFTLSAALMLIIALPASAQDVVTYTTEDSFDDVIFGLENAIIDQGLVIEGTSHVSEMLDRTGPDVGSDKVIFLKADVYSFCSAALSRKVMEADPMNLQFCPYGIFVMVKPEAPDQTIIGFRSMPEGPMKEVQALLDTITRAAIELD